MAKKACVLCGAELGMFDCHTIPVCETAQPVCSDCNLTYFNATNPEKEAIRQQILASPHLVNQDAIHAYQKEVSGKVCPACGAELERKLKNFSIGADGYGGLSSMVLEQYVVDLFACPKCGKVELYTAGFIPEGTQEPNEPEKVVCPDCGTKHSAVVDCPSCAVRAARSGSFFRSQRKAPETPPWEK